MTKTFIINEKEIQVQYRNFSIGILPTACIHMEIEFGDIDMNIINEMKLATKLQIKIDNTVATLDGVISSTFEIKEKVHDTETILIGDLTIEGASLTLS